ncbi:hybrid sensor histidine kinase/response regulator transcription factor [Bacteroides ihuae]|uniref:hybrid sensor histidine kinase/response regulator transcription factor n=1 Tax=Bacteroides ihuae TaxID=1852362 RepID=UPI00098F532E|nr:hybrid sensor histidine kinase/response regulator transcription factor [Bacteroides ihuae]
MRMLPRLLFRICLFTVFLIFITQVQAQSKDNIEAIQFRHINVNNGLSNNQVNCIIKDSRGFMWFGTSSGLNRYDGYRMRQYFGSENNSSLWGDAISAIQEDSRGYLWLSVGASYILYDRNKDSFIRDFKGELSKLGIICSSVKSIYVDANKDLWAYDGAKLFYYQFSSKKLSKFYQGKNASCLSEGEIMSMTHSREYYYVIHRSGVIEKLHARTGKVVLRNNFLSKHSDFSGEGLHIYQDVDSNLWVYTDVSKGLWRWNVETGIWTYFGIDSSKHPLSHDFIRSVIDDRKGNIWIATDHGGINLLNKDTETIVYLKNDPEIPTSVNSNSIICLYLDDEGIMWTGSFKKGISYYSETAQKFRPYYLKDSSQSIYKYDVNSIDEDFQNNIWMGTDGNGLVKVNKSTGDASVYKASNRQKDAVGNVIVSLYRDSKDKLWIGTFLDGLSCYDNGTFTHYKHDKTPNSIARDNVWAIDEDRHGNIWLGFLNGGLQMYDPLKNTFETYKLGESESDLGVMDLFCRRGKFLYVGTAYGLGILNTDTKKSEKLYGNRKGSQEFSDKFLNCLFYDSRGLLWLGGNRGISILDERTDSLIYLDKKEGLYDNIVRGIVEDDNKNMWVMTSSGLSNIIVNVDPVNKSFNWTIHNYDENDGLLGRNFGGRLYKNRNGEIIIGGSNGYNIINPNYIVYNKILSKVTFTGLKIGNTEINVDSLYDDRVILKRGIDQTRELELNYSDNIFFIEYSALDYSHPLKTKYAYKLEGLNTNWIYTNESKISFTNLNPGEYVLKIKAANSDGFWNEDASSMVIIVHPPFWLSIYAYLLYLLLFLSAIYYVVCQIRRKHYEKLKIQRIEMEAERQRKINEMKLRFFTNISHDFRTPLSLIITPLEKLIEDNNASPMASRLQMIHRNAVQLLNLVNQLLDFRKLDVKGDTLMLLHGDYVYFVREVCESFVEYAEKKSINLSIYSSLQHLEMSFDKDKIRKVLMNLLSNAFKYTPDGGCVVVRIEVDVNQMAERKVKVSVEDTGIGISDEEKPCVFDRFYQIAQPKLNYGSGIGLHIVKEFVNLHGGDVMLSDNKPCGSIFSFTIPVNAADKSEKIMLLNAADNALLPQEPREEPNKALLSAILIVEDNEDFRLFVADSLKDAYVVLQAVNGEEALKVLQANAVDVIVSDVMMPVMDGLELCHRVKNDINLSHIPVILLTARTTDEHKLEGLSEGADDYITKPFNLNILKLRINKFIEWNKKNHERFRRTIDINPSEITISSLDEKLIAKAVKIVEDNMSNTEFSVEELSSSIGMSRGHLYKKLLSITGKTPIEFIRIIRLKRATQLLGKSQLNISEIAYEVGFNSPKIFAKYYREEYNMSPSEYIKSQKNG